MSLSLQSNLLHSYKGGQIRSQISGRLLFFFSLECPCRSGLAEAVSQFRCCNVLRYPYVVEFVPIYPSFFENASLDPFQFPTLETSS